MTASLDNKYRIDPRPHIDLGDHKIYTVIAPGKSTLSYREIPLTYGKVATVSVRAYESVRHISWSARLSSDVILEAERAAFAKWGAQRLFSYIDPAALSIKKKRGREYCPWPTGRCFREAGWKPLVYKNGTSYLSSRGLLLFVKLWRG